MRIKKTRTNGLVQSAKRLWLGAPQHQLWFATRVATLVDRRVSELECREVSDLCFC